MRQSLEPLPEVQLSVQNIGGITKASETLHPGVTVLVGRNATNRTSFLQGLAAALGTDRFTLKRDANTGEVALTVGQETYTRQIKRKDGQLVVNGEPYVETSEVAALFAVLFESNEIRSAIRGGGDIRELIVRPLDLAHINDRISKIVTKRRRIDERLDENDHLAEKISDRESQREEYERRLEELNEEILEKEQALERVQAESDDGRTQSELEAKLEENLDELHDRQSELAETREKLEIERKSLDSLRTDREAVLADLEELQPPDSERLARLEERIDRLRERKRSLDSSISELQQVIRFNDQRLAEDQPGIFRQLDDEADPVAQLDPSGRGTVCWTCGTEVDRERIEDTIARLRDLREERSAERGEVTNEIETARNTLSDLEAKQEQHDRLASKLEQIDEKLGRRENTVERLEGKTTRLESNVEELESVIEELKTKRQSEVLERQETVSQLRFERGRVRDQLNDIESEIDSLRSRLADRERLETERNALSEELRELRTRVERLESEAIESFNSHMESILEILEYENIERIWLEATGSPVGDSQDVTERVFKLHIVRESATGTVYEDSIEHLSESERELVGLVVALSGYLAHEVHEEVPFMLLDSLEMIDGERLAALASYLDEFVPYLILVLLPDHAAAFAERDSLPDHRITDI